MQTKVRIITSDRLEKQSYLRLSDSSQEELNTITAFRSQCSRDIKYNCGARACCNITRKTNEENNLTLRRNRNCISYTNL